MEIAGILGGFFRWLFKRCKSNLNDEIKGRFDGIWLKEYSDENVIIGFYIIIVIIFVFGLIINY